MLANHCDLIAGAAEWMGRYYGYRKFENIDFEAMAKTQLWMVRSTNDNVVKIDSTTNFIMN